MLLFPADGPDFFYHRPGQGKDGPAVAHAIRFQASQFGNEVQRHLRRFQFLVDVDQGDVISRRHVGCGIIEQALAQGLDILGLDGKACCHGVAAELDEQVLGILQGFVHIETADAAARALADAVADGDDQGWPIVRFHQARCGNADDADVPALVIGDEDAVASPPLPFDLSDGFLGNGVLDVLALCVEMAQFGRIGRSLSRIGLQEQFDAFRGMADTAGRIEARRRRKGDAAGRDVPAAQIRRVEEGLEARPLPLFHGRQAIADEDAVLAGQRDQIGNGPQGGQVGIARQVLLAVMLPQSPAEDVGHAGSGQLLEGIRAAVLLGIEDGQGRRNQVRRLVMIRNNHIQDR